VGLVEPGALDPPREPQAGEVRLGDVAKSGGDMSFHRATERPFKLVFEGRPVTPALAVVLPA
jgi:hypothetical protein